MNYGDAMIKLPRKNLVNIIEKDQAKLIKLIDDGKKDINKKVK